VAGFICNALIKPLKDSDFMTEEELAQERQLAHERALKAEASMSNATVANTAKSSPVVVLLAWLAVGIPMAWGMMITLEKAMKFLK
ncbi:MAG: MFS transporter, partial [Burkholderiales bacterium]|nr:MFS transporter [Burkholderiales bacterium]